MVLSSYSNWGTDLHNFYSGPIHQAKQAQTQLLAENQQLDYYWDQPELPFAFLDPYMDLNDNFLCPENYNPLLPYFSSAYDPLISFSPENETFPYESLGSIPCPKRQKLIEGNYCADFVPAFFDGVALNPCSLPEHQRIQQVNLDGGFVEGAKKMNDKSVSVQSIAARERRRKITEKTQELGKLVPGGNKMNTAEMLQAAFNYIKYLQAQVGILEFMDSFSEKEKMASRKENMQIVTSPKVQEKLYMEEKCVVPKDFLVSLTRLSKPPLSDELRQLTAVTPHE